MTGAALTEPTHESKGRGMNENVANPTRSGVPRRAAAGLAIASVLLLVPAAPVVAHPGGHGTDQSALPAPPPEPQAKDSGGGTSPLVGGGVAVGLLGLAGGLISLREKQRRARAVATGSQPEAKATGTPSPGAARPTAAAKRRARSSW